MSKYVPQVTGISRGRVFSHKPVTNCFLDLEKSINGEVNQENFEEDKVLGIRSLHERSLTETFRSRQLIWNEEAVWVFGFRSGSTTNFTDHLGINNNLYTVEEAATRVLIPHSCVVEVHSQIQIDSILWSALDQSNEAGGTSLAALGKNAGGAIATAEMPGLDLKFWLYAGDIGATTYTLLDEAYLSVRMDETTDASFSVARQKLRRGHTVHLNAIETVSVDDDSVRVGKARDYFVRVSGVFQESEEEDGTVRAAVDVAQLAYATVRSKARHLTATAYYGSKAESASSKIGAP